MDKFWSIFGVPIGLTICFGPAMIVYWLTHKKESAAEKKQNENRH